ncbi:hypothetical protein KKB99_08500, partial [bacterium]|nr:hypothetical protein [bacterium]MBU1026031.1 hypothetical protein [bacterium]
MDDSYNVVTDYMADKRRFMPNEASADKHRYYMKDHQGTVVAMTDHDQNVEEYNYDAWGEHIDNTDFPTATNLVRYAGARVENFADAGNEKDAIYKMGVRHYWPKYSRFLQRDPMAYRQMPNPRFPLSVNPYIYSDNNPVMKSDPSGMVAVPTGWVRGAKMGNAKWWIGTTVPPDSLMCDCDNGYVQLSEDEIEARSYWGQRKADRAAQNYGGCTSSGCRAGASQGGYSNIGEGLAAVGATLAGLLGFDWSALQPDN